MSDRPLEAVARAIGRRRPRYEQLDGLRGSVLMVVNREERDTRRGDQNAKPQYEHYRDRHVVFVDPRQVLRGTPQAVAEYIRDKAIRERVLRERWTGAVRGRKSNEWIQLTGHDKILYTSA